MTKQDRAMYLVNLLAIMDSKAKSGHSQPGDTLAKEYNFNYDELIKEIKDEAGKRS